MSLQGRLCALALFAGLTAAVPLWGQNQLLVSCPAHVNAGSLASCQVSLALQNGVQADSIDFTVSVTPTAGAATYTDTLTGATKTNGTTYSSVLYSGVGPLSGTTVLGSINFTVPAGATAGSTYMAAFTGAEVSFQNNDVVPALSFSSTSTITVTTLLAIVNPATGATLPGATAGQAYSETIGITGGTGPYTFSLTGSWPNGFAISSLGLITGTFPAATSFNGTLGVSVKDSSAVQETASATYSLTVNPAITAVAPATLPSGSVGASYTSGNISVTGGTAPYTFSTTANLASLALSLTPGPAATATITSASLTTAAAGFSIPLKVIDAAGATFTGNLTLTITGPLALSPANSTALATATVGTGYTTGATISASGGVPSPSYTFSVNNGLPAGLGISAATGQITGTPAVGANGPYNNIQVTVTDNDGHSVTNTYTMVVDLAITLTAPGTIPGGTTGAPYPSGINFSATGGSGTYTWSVAGLPGVTASPASGASTSLSGSPTVASAADSVTITVTDSNGATASKTYNNVVIAVGVSITGPAAGALAGATDGTAYGPAGAGVTVTSANGTGPFTWSLANATTLPMGLTLTPTGAQNANVIIGGTVPLSTAAANTTFTLQVADSTGSVATRQYSIANFLQPSLTAPASLPAADLSSAYNTAAANPVTLTGGAPTIVWSATGVPAGLSISANTGAITGTPTTVVGSPFTVNFKVTDGNGAIATASSTLVVNPALTITTATPLPPATQGGPYTTPLAASGGSGAGFTFSLAAGSTPFPAGLSINGASITGTPTTVIAAATTTNNIVIMLTDNTGSSITKTFSLTTNPALSITNASPLPGATLNTAYPLTFAATGGTAPLVWTQANLPAGLTLSAAGVISGSPSATGTTANIMITATDVNTAFVTKTFSLTVNALPVVGGPASLPVATVSSTYTSGATVTLTGGTPNITWSATGLPAGLSINAGTGVITGTPTTNAASPYTVNVKVVDANAATSNQNFNLVVNPALSVTPATLPVGIPSVKYTSTTLTATGGSGGGYTFAATGLPVGLTLSAGGVISGTPAANASTNSPYTVQVTVTDATPASRTFTYTLAVAPPLSISGPATLLAGTVNVPYTPTTVTAAGGTQPYAFTATGLPPGLNIASGTGVVSGTPTAVAGSPYAVVVKVTDANSTTATMNYSILVGALPLQIITGLLPPGVLNTAYPATPIVVQGGVQPYTFTITGLPAGLTTDGNGNISGTPTTTTGSPFSVVVKVTDATLTSVSRTYSLAISGTLTVMLPTTLPPASLNNAYAPVTAVAGGGLPPYTWTATGLPTGLSIAKATGVISGTPTTAAGTPYSVTLTVTDSTGKTASQTYTLVENSPLTITGPGSLPSGTVGAAYPGATVTASGGSTVYTFSATGLPSGLVINTSTGAISGTPSAGTAGTDSVVLTVTDSSSNTATKSYSLTINPGPTTVPVISSVSTNTEGQNIIGPNTWVSIYGSNFTAPAFTDTWTTTIKASSSGALPIILDGVSAQIGGQQAYVEYVSATQINVLTPNIGFGPVMVTVTTTGGTSNAVAITSQQDIPGLFEWPNNQPVATHADYSYVAANGSIPGMTTVPAAPGETIVVWGSGFGPTSPANPFGVAIPATPTFSTVSNVTVTLNNIPLTVYGNNAFLASGNAGLFQIGVTIPATLANGTYPLVTTIGSVSSPPLMLTVHN